MWGALHNRTARWGLTLWSSVNSRWQAVKIPVTEWPGPDFRVAFADVTGDGRADLLFEENPTGGSGSCGPHRIFSTSLRGDTTQVFSSSLCDASLSADHGLLAFDMPADLEPEPHCCPEFYEHLRLRWDGHRFVQDSLRFEKSGLY